MTLQARELIASLLLHRTSLGALAAPDNSHHHDDQHQDSSYRRDNPDSIIDTVTKSRVGGGWLCGVICDSSEGDGRRKGGGGW